jgi:exodeoxyribonuclease VII large subunit
VFDLQKELPMPLFCQRIAVISSETAAGYGDFCNQLSDNPYGFQFKTWLFPAIMQGEGIERSIIEALNRINAVCDDFDAVAIIRGGGATSDMSGFDTLALAENVANFPLPIITGIGHERDESVLDMVSHTRVKTPTAAATFLISHLKEVLDVVNHAQDLIARYAQQKLSILNAQLSTISEMIPRLFSVVKTRQEAKLESLQSHMISEIQQKIVGHQSRLEGFEQRIPILLERKLLSERHRLEMMTEKVKSLDPTLLLQRGYSITLKDGKAVRDAAILKENDIIETRLSKGTIRSKVTK